MFKGMKILTVIILLVTLAIVVVSGNNRYEKFKQELNSKVNSEIEKKISKSIQDIKKINENSLKDSNLNVLILGDQIADSYGTYQYIDKWTSIFLNNLKNKYNLKYKTTNLVGYNKSFFSIWVDYVWEFERYNKKADIVIISVGRAKDNYEGMDYAVYFENIIRRILKRNLNTHVIFVAQDSIENQDYYTKLKNISEIYKINFVDMKYANENSNMDTSQFLNDSKDLTLEGNKFYAQTIIKSFDEYLSIIDKANYYVPPILSKNIFKYENLKISTDLITSEDMQEKIEYNGRKYYRAPWSDNFFEASFNGELLGIYVLKTQDSGDLRIYVDDTFVKQIPLYNNISNIEQILVSDNLANGNHKVRIEVVQSTDLNAKGRAANIFGIISK